jgi:SAM-dependent methyltransferase
MRERRLVFGEVAELYDRYRPSYPEQLIDDLAEMARLDGSRPVLEVGAGTGKATAMFASRGIPVLALEPSAEMAAVAERSLAEHHDVMLERSDFERWPAGEHHFPLVFSAQAWHWVEPSRGYPKARDILLPGGLLAVFWNLVDWRNAELRDALLEAYERIAPDLEHHGAMHPGADVEPDTWGPEIDAVEGLRDPEVRHYHREEHYTAEDYVGLLATGSEIRMLEEGRRSALLTGVAEVIDDNGGRLTVPMDTRLCLASRAG